MRNHCQSDKSVQLRGDLLTHYNTHFRVRDHFILDFAGTCLLAHFGDDREVQILDENEVIGAYAFTEQGFLESGSFGPSPRLRLVGALLGL
jgi:hypothetical protein